MRASTTMQHNKLSTLIVLALGGMLTFAACNTSSEGDRSDRRDKHSSRQGRAKTTASQAAEGPNQQAEPAATETPGEKPEAGVDPAKLGQQLYAQHCAACHGERGDGKGIAAAYLFPKARDFRAGRFRLVGTENQVPSREDLQAVLLRGMPGSAMPPWPHLTPAERDALVDEIMQLRRAGVRDEFVRVMKEEQELSDEEIASDETQAEMKETLERSTTPGPATEIPVATPATAEAVARGQEHYMKQGCYQCHGKDGKGDGTQPMVDAEGLATRPRDFTRGIFKGGTDVASLYRRVAHGMPGTPMPSSQNLTPEQTIDIVHFMLSLSTEEVRQAAVLNREKIVVSRSAQLPAADDEQAWQDIKPTRLRMTPLWWRSDAEPDFQVQAAHDGKKIAVRLSWKDESHDSHAAQSSVFEDGVAMQLYRGATEPFLGMGGPAAQVDVWYWDADRQGPLATVESVYPNTVVDLFPFSEQVVASAELNRAGARTADQPDVSLPAKASGNPIVPDGHGSGASSLTAGGPGSATFRLPKSQVTRAVGQWKDGRWSVVMTRSLAVAAADGVTLEPGGGASAAFAVWDGSHHDRDGQKLITIWQDLSIEE